VQDTPRSFPACCNQSALCSLCTQSQVSWRRGDTVQEIKRSQSVNAKVSRYEEAGVSGLFGWMRRSLPKVPIRRPVPPSPLSLNFDGVLTLTTSRSLAWSARNPPPPRLQGSNAPTRIMPLLLLQYSIPDLELCEAWSARSGRTLQAWKMKTVRPRHANSA